MNDDAVVRFLNTHYPESVDSRTSTYFDRKGNSIVYIKDECYRKGLLELKDNRGVWLYIINKKGKAFRDSKPL